MEFRPLKCDSCNLWNSPMSKTCRGCGKDLTLATCIDLLGLGIRPMKNCNNCATWNDKDAKYCRNCGIEYYKQ